MRRIVIFLCFLILFTKPALASESDLVISEIMYDADGADSGHEWIEIYNAGSEDVVVSSTWRFFDSSNHKINFFQGTTTIGDQEFFVLVDKPEEFLLDYPSFEGSLFDTVMSLPNSSSTIAMSFDGGVSFPIEIFYDSAWGGEEGFGLQLIDNQWQENCTLGGSPGLANTQCVVEELPPEEESQNWSQLIINELLPNPIGSDDNEWIELYNQGPDALDLDGIKIKDNSSRIFALDIDSEVDLNLPANNYLLIPKNVSGISLNNSKGDGVFILDKSEHIIDSIIYNDSAIEGRSYAKSDNDFVWTKEPSPGQRNIISINKKPIAQIKVINTLFLLGEKIEFSASSSYDPDGEELDYLWEFGDDKTSSRENIKHSFDNIGAYVVRLTVTDSEGASDIEEFSIDIKSPKEEVEEVESLSEEKMEIMDLAEDDILISEFIPNPVGSDDNEWIEIYNNSDRQIDLYAWQIDDIDGGSKPYQFSTSTIILPGDFLLVDRQDTKITLNNSGDQVRILNWEDDIFQVVEYEKIPEGKSYAWDKENKEWNVNNPSPGLENIFLEEKIEESIYGISEINDLEKNQEVIIQGVVINSVTEKDRSLYLADYNFSSINFEEIAEIYFYYKDWPDIKVGDLITVRGKISRLDSLPRIKIKNKEDIWKNDINIKIIEPDITDIEILGEDLVGSYIKTKGYVVKKSGKNTYLATDIKEDYILRVYTRFSVKELGIKKEDEVMISGILSETDNGFKIVPFEIGDISVSKSILGEKIEGEKYEEIEISTSTSQIKAENRKNNTKNKLIIISIGLGFLFFIYLLKKKLSRPSS